MKRFSITFGGLIHTLSKKLIEIGQRKKATRKSDCRNAILGVLQ
jgi:hypothetical protein